MRKKKQVKAKITKGEKKLYSLAIIAFVFTMVLKIFCGAGIGHLNMSIEQTKFKIETQEKKNESLTMQVNELTSFDKVKDIVSNMGLAYNNDNVVVIDGK